MADIADDADVINQLHLEKSLAEQAEAAKKNKLRPKGVCHYCNEPIHETAVNQIFCDVECRDEFERVYRRGV